MNERMKEYAHVDPNGNVRMFKAESLEDANRHCLNYLGHAVILPEFLDSFLEAFENKESKDINVKHEDKELWDEIDAIEGLSKESKENAYNVISELKRS